MHLKQLGDSYEWGLGVVAGVAPFCAPLNTAEWIGVRQ